MSRLALAIGLTVLILTGCSKYTGPYRVCLKSHQESQMTMTTYDGGKSWMPVWNYFDVCDKYTKEQYIKVDKTIYRVEEAWKEN